MMMKFGAVALGLAFGSLALGLPATARGTSHGYRELGVPTAWSRMARSRAKRVSRKGAGTASASAPNGTRGGIGPTGQPSGVK